MIADASRLARISGSSTLPGAQMRAGISAAIVVAAQNSKRSSAIAAASSAANSARLAGKSDSYPNVAHRSRQMMATATAGTIAARSNDAVRSDGRSPNSHLM